MMYELVASAACPPVVLRVSIAQGTSGCLREEHERTLCISGTFWLLLRVVLCLGPQQDNRRFACPAAVCRHREPCSWAAQIHTVGVGVAIGQSCMLLSAGARGKRYMLPHATGITSLSAHGSQPMYGSQLVGLFQPFVSNSFASVQHSCCGRLKVAAVPPCDACPCLV